MARKLHTWILAALAVSLLSALFAAPASADRAFSTRFQTDAQGDITFAANTVLTCTGGGGGGNSCANSQAGTGSASKVNNDWAMVNVDVDSDGTTFNSSRATVALPGGVSGSDVLFAGLYWGADTAGGPGGNAAPNAAIKDQIRFSRPGLSGYTTITASQVDSSETSVTRYQAFADVTSLVQAGGSGTYGVANVQAGTGADRYGGWTLVIAYEDLAQPLRNLVVRDGLDYILGGESGAIPLEGFITPTSGTVKAKLGLMSWEGELGYTPETVTLNGTTISDAQNPADNVFNSSISLNGTRFSSKTPDYVNQLGFDADIISIDGLLTNGATSANLNFSSALETLIPAVTTLAIDQAPRRPIATPGNGPVISGTAQEGSTLSTTTGAFTGTKPFTYTYQWERCDSAGANCQNIGGATNSTYSLVPADIGSTLRVTVTASNASGSDSAQSSVTTVITARNPVNTALPTVSGTAQEGSTLTAAEGSWTGTAPISYSYQWLRCNSSGSSCQNIGGATSSTYGLVVADIGATIRVRVTGTNVGGSSSADSSQTGVISARNPANTAVPTISGAPQLGSTLTAGNGTWTGTTPISYSYQWLRCDSSGANCSDINGATSSTYDPVAADLGSTIRVRVTGTNVGGSSSAQSAQTAVVSGSPPANTVAPGVSGTAQEGSTLTASNGTWTGTAPITYSYQWLRCDSSGANCSNIASATSASYALVPADVGFTIRIRVTGTNAIGNSAAQSSQTSVIVARPPVNTALPTLSGTAQEGSTLTASNGTWTGTAPISFSYQWLRCDSSGGNCSDIGGATNSTYSLVPGDVAAAIRVRVTATNASGSPVNAQSAPTAAVAARLPANTAVPTISGTTQAGSTLTASNGSWTGTAPITYAYQWLRCDSSGANCSDIGGATNGTYDLVPGDVGSTIRVRVTGTNVGGDSSAQSAHTNVIGAVAPSNTALPTTSGAAQEGSTLTATQGSWAGTGPLTYSYQWLRCDSSGASCSVIGGATNSTYDLVPADVAATIRVRVTADGPGGSSAAESTATDQVLAREPVNTGAPTISGSAQEGSTLTAGNGTWTGTAPITFTYQWMRCDAAGANCADIGGATSGTYSLVPADIGATIRVRVSGDNVGGFSTADSAETVVVSARSPANTAIPTVSGTAQDGSTLTASNGTWTGTAPIDFTYEWQRCDAAGANCSVIGGATSSTYDLVPADIGSTIRVSVTGSNAGGSSSAQSAPTGTVGAEPPGTGGPGTTPPSVSGSSQEGSTLTADPGTWSGTGPFTFTYEWQRCDAAGTNCSVIGGATDSTYDLVPADVGSTIRVVVTATNAGGGASANSAASGQVTPRLPVNTTAPAVAGTLRDGEVLTADPGAWDGTPQIDFTYEWLSCVAGACSPIAGETGSTYIVTSADVGNEIAVAVTATNAAGSATEVSAPAGPVLPELPGVSVDPSISGNAFDGQTLILDPGTWKGTAPFDFAYQWQRCTTQVGSCVDIDGAQGEAYELVSEDVDFWIRAVVTTSNAAGQQSAASSTVGPVQPVAPANQTAPSISGTPADEQVLTANPGVWNGTDPIDFSYQWRRCDGGDCMVIGGATGSEYVLTDADVGFEIRVRVTATNGTGSDSALSALVGPVTATQPGNTTVPSVGGTGRDGETLTADPGQWNGTGPFEHTYQWQRCDSSGCTDIDGATGQTYDLTDADVGFMVRVVVTTTGPGGTDSKTSEALGPVVAQAPGNTTAPSISGTPRDGQTLGSNAGEWSGTGPLDYSYQWLRCQGNNCDEITGATGQTYQAGADDVGYELVLQVTATNGGGSTTQESNRIGPVAGNPPSASTPPSLGGNPSDGGNLTANPGNWTGTGPIDYTYQWLRCDAAGNNCVPIPGATGSTYTPGPDDVGHTIRVDVTATGPGGSVTERSDPIGPIAATPPANVEPPTFGGTLEPGSVLTADPGGWSGTGPFDFSYQWMRCDADGENCVEIPGANGGTYVLTPADVGSTIVVRVTASNGAGSANAETNASGRVASPSVNPNEDLSQMPGSLVNENRCQQAPRPVAASVAVRGIGRMRFRVAATDGIISAANPLLAASTKTRVRRGSLNRLIRAVGYRLDRRPLRVVRRAPYAIAIPPARLAGSPRHTLTVTTVAKNGRRSRVNIPFRTSPCTALFTANHRVAGRRGALRLRVDTKYAIRSLAFRLPTALIPRVRQRTSSGRLQLFLGGGNRPLYRLTFGTRSARNGTVLSRAGAPRVSIRGRRVSVASLPARVGIIKLQLVKRGSTVRRLRQRTTLYAQVDTAAGKQLMKIRIGPKRRAR